MSGGDGAVRAGVVRAVGTIGLATLASRILGYTRDIVLARAFGASPLTDAFFVAFRIPNLLRRLLAEGALSTAIIPVFSETLARSGPASFGRMVQAVAGVGTVVLTGVSLLGMLLAPWIVALMAPGWKAELALFDLAVMLTRLMFPYLLLVGLAALAMGVLNTHHRFFTAALAPAILNVAMIGAVLGLGPRMSPPILALGVGVLVGGLGQFLVQLPELRRLGVPLMPSLDWSHPALRQIAHRLWPAVFSLAAVQVTVVVNTLIASLLRTGTVSYLYYADRVMEFPLGVFGIALATAVLPSMSSQAARGEHAALRSTLGFALRLSAFIAVPAAVGLVALAEPIVRLLLERGAFGPSRVALHRAGPRGLCHRPARILRHPDHRADVLCAGRHPHAGARGIRLGRRQRRVRAVAHGAPRAHGLGAGLVALGVREPGRARVAPEPSARRARGG